MACWWLVLLCPDALSPAVWIRRVLLSARMAWACIFRARHALVRRHVRRDPRLVRAGLARQILIEADLIAAGCLAYLVGKIGWRCTPAVPVSTKPPSWQRCWSNRICTARSPPFCMALYLALHPRRKLPVSTKDDSRRSMKYAVLFPGQGSQSVACCRRWPERRAAWPGPSTKPARRSAGCCELVREGPV